MRLSWSVAILLLVVVAVSIEAARSRSSRFSYRGSSRYSRFSYRSRSSRIRFSRGYRYSYRYRSSRHTYHMGPIYGRRLSPSVMGPMYFGYSSRYPMHFSYRSAAPMSASREICTNNLALDNGSHIGVFSCPFLPDEPREWTSCCGYEAEEFCCDPSYNDSWKNVGMSVVAIVMTVLGNLVGVGIVVGLLIFCCCIKKKRSSTASPFIIGKAATANPPQQGQPFVDPSGKQAEGSNPLPPPYPTMEYGTIQPQVDAGAGTRGYNLAPYPPQPPPYRSD